MKMPVARPRGDRDRSPDNPHERPINDGSGIHEQQEMASQAGRLAIKKGLQV